MELNKCHVTKKEFPKVELRNGENILSQLLSLIKKGYPDFTTKIYISTEQLNIYRNKYFKSLLKSENKELGKLEKDILSVITF